MRAKHVIQDQRKGLFQRGEIWWMAFTPAPGAKQMRITLGTKDLVVAIQKAAEIRAFPDRYAAKEDGDLVEAFLTHQQRRGISKARLDFSRIALSDMTKTTGAKIEHTSAAMAQRWFNTLLARIKPKSAKDYLGVANVFFKWAVNARHVTSSPVALIIPPKVRPTPRRVHLTMEQARKVLDSCTDKELKFCLYCALHAGLRRGEVIAARPHWFDMGNGSIHVQNEADWLTKDRDNRSIPLTAEFKEFLKDYGIHSPYMFRPGDLPKAANRTWRYRCDFIKKFNNYMEAMGLDNVTFHDLRRTFASLHASSGTPIFHIARWLGDDPSVVEQVYAHLRPNDERINGPWNEAKAKKEAV